MSEALLSNSAILSEGVGDKESRISDYFALLKPRVMSLVVFTGFAGFWVAPNALSINMWYDRDIDVIMKRTRGRPIPMGRVDAEEALAFGVILSIFSVMIMGMALNWVAAGVLAFANFFYVVIYTMLLKRSTPQNIVIGGAAGAFPPIVGWAAATGTVSWESVVLFAIIFFWTPPHFWALSLFANSDYKAAKIPMMPVIAGEKSTKIQMLAYTLVLFPVTLMPYFMGYAGVIYLASAIILSGFFVVSAIKVLFSDDMKHARLMFSYSVFYLFALFLAVMIDAS